MKPSKFRLISVIWSPPNFSKNALVRTSINIASPIGQALEMSLNWDGYDINNTLSRVVEIK